MKKVLITLILVCIALLIVLVVLSKPATPPEKDSQSAQWLKLNHSAVTSLDIVFTDNTRTTQAYKDFEGEPFRRLTSSLWLPEFKQTESRHPVLVYSHGFSSMRNGGEHIASYLAQLGYIVIAADYPLTNMNAPAGPWVRDVVNQVGDVSFLLNELQHLNVQKDHVLFQRIDFDRVAAAGISLGGMTSLLAAFDPARKDPRIKAIISIAGPSSMFGAQYFANSNIPMLMIASPDDTLMPYQDHARPLLEKYQHASLLTLAHASHTGFASSARLLRWLDNPDILGCYIVKKRLAEDTAEEPWFDLLGTQEQGIIDDHESKLCEVEPLPSVINPLDQHLITQLAVASFLEAQFAQSVGKDAAAKFLFSDLSKDFADLKIESRNPQYQAFIKD